MSQPSAPARADSYPGYGTFVIEQRNGYPQAPGAQWRITAGGAGARMEDPAYPRYGERHENLDAAVDEVRRRLEAERQRLLERAEGCLQQLNQLEAHYAPQPSPGQSLLAQRDKLLACLVRFKQGKNVGDVKFTGFSISLPYLHSNNLLVVSLPEYGAINPRFLASDIELLAGIVSEAGFEDAPCWNGEECFSVSFQLPMGKRKEAEALETEHA